MRKLLLVLSMLPILTWAQSQDRNYILTKSYKTPSATSISQPSVGEAATDVTYFDGLGRPIQKVQYKQGANGNLRDKMKPDTNRPKGLEAMPNPILGYTNVIVNYDYENGTATVADISGHILQTFELGRDRTVPVDLSGYPEGIYVINGKTDKGSDGVKG